MNVREAVDAPRMDHEWMPDSVRIERGGADDALLASLKAMGHLNVSAGGFQGDANSILIDGAGTAWGAADTTRSADGKASVPSRASTSAVR
jgi:gamma-glutamyltranspeptidase/glutathione hydrolase